MPNRLPVPEELSHLIEKREADVRRSGEERRQVDLGAVGAVESISDLEELSLEERRLQAERRENGERRANP